MNNNFIYVTNEGVVAEGGAHVVICKDGKHYCVDIYGSVWIQGNCWCRKLPPSIDICPYCGKKEVEIDDFGWYGCRDCFSNSKLKKYVADMQEREDFMFGYKD